jgi:excisionase family DNA binding protein
MAKIEQTQAESTSNFDPLTGKVLTVREVASYLRVHSSTIYRLLKKGQLPAFRIGSDWRFMVDQIDRWREEAEALGGPSAIAGRSKSAK